MKTLHVTLWLRSGQKIKLKVKKLTYKVAPNGGGLQEYHFEQKVYSGEILHYANLNEIVAITCTRRWGL